LQPLLSQDHSTAEFEEALETLLDRLELLLARRPIVARCVAGSGLTAQLPIYPSIDAALSAADKEEVGCVRTLDHDRGAALLY
jgi:hypothetical protein